MTRLLLPFHVCEQPEDEPEAMSGLAPLPISWEGDEAAAEPALAASEAEATVAADSASAMAVVEAAEAAEGW